MSRSPEAEAVDRAKAELARAEWARTRIAEGATDGRVDVDGGLERDRTAANVANTANAVRVRALRSQRTTPAERVELELREGILVA